MSRIFKFSKFALKLFVSHASKLTDMKIYIYTDNFDIAYVITSGFKINVNEVGIVIPQNAVSNMTDGVINYRIEGYLNGDFYMEQRQSNYYLKTPSFGMDDTNIIAVSTEFVDGGDYKMIIKASEYNADGLSQVEIDATTFAEKKYEEGKTKQKSLLEPITITENGTYENENGFSTIEVNVEGGDCPELEDVTITENGEYEGAFGKVVVDVPQEGGDINPDTLREITITENGVYTSKYSSPIEGEITGYFDDGTPFYGYGELNGIIYDTQFIPQKNENGLVFEKVEFWYKGDNITTDAYWNVILSSAPADDSIDAIEFRYIADYNNYLSLRVDGMNDWQLGTIDEGSWYHFLLYMENGNVILKINDQEVLNTPKATSTQYNPVPFYINGAPYDIYGGDGNRNANGCFGMIKIDDQTFIPTENGFINYNTQEPLPVVKEGEYSYNTTDVIFEGEPYKTIYVDVPQEGGGCNLEPLWVSPSWYERDESNYVNYNPSEGNNGFDSVHIDLYTVYEDGKQDGKQETINSLGHLVVTESGSYTAEKRWETRKYVHLDGDDYFEINAFISHTDKIVFDLMRYDFERRMILGNPTCYFAFDYAGLVANYRGKYTNPIPVDNMKWVKVTMTTDYGLEVISENGKISEPWQGDFIYPNIEDNFTIGKGFGDYEFNFGGNISTIEIHDGSNIEVYKPFPNGWGQGSFATLDGTLYENQGDGTATYVEESYEVGVDGWKSVEVNVPQNGGDCSDIENAQEIIITENGIYKSKYSDIPTGDNFRSYATLTNSVYNTGINPNSNTKVELWWNNTTATQENFECFIFGTQDPTWKIMYTQNMDGVFISEINYCDFNFEFPYQGWHHIEMSYADGLIINGEKINDFGCNLENEIEQPIYINGNPSSQHNFINGQYGMIKITKDGETTTIIPTAEGFLNTNTGEYLTQVEDGQYEFEEINYDNGDLFKTIIVDVSSDNVPKYPYLHIPTNTIYYKTANGQICENIGLDNIGSPSSFGLGINGKILNIVSNTYEDGVGKIVFDDVVYGVGPVMYSNAIETGNSALELENIVEIQLPSCVRSVKLGAFSQTGLREIILPPDIREINTYALRDMKHLYRIVFYSSEPEILENNEIGLDQTTFGKILHSKAYDYSNMENNTYYKDKGWTFETF